MARRFRRRPPAAVIAVVVLGLAIAAPGFYALTVQSPKARLDQPPREGEYEVVRVVDGETIIVTALPPSDDTAPAAKTAQQLTVRLIGVKLRPATETDGRDVQPADRATEFAQRFLAGGTARLRFDRRKLDLDGRLLAYVFVDETMLNAELVRQGFAEADHYPGDSAAMARRIRKAEDEAQDAAR